LDESNKVTKAIFLKACLNNLKIVALIETQTGSGPWCIWLSAHYQNFTAKGNCIEDSENSIFNRKTALPSDRYLFHP
jgi:hypothetical protein